MKISGPISVHVIKRSNKYIVLWGDRHGDKKQYCRCHAENPACMFISTFIKRIQDNYDLFIESPWYSSAEKQDLIGKQFVNVNAMRTMANTFYQDMYFHGKNNKKNRVHFTDIRTEKTIRPLTSIINQLMGLLYDGQELDDLSFIETLQKYKSVRMIKAFVDIVVKDGNHKIGKQITKLSRGDQKVIKRFHKDMCKTLLVKTKEYDYGHYQLFHRDKNEYTADMLVVFENLLLWLSYLKDIYTISRMLYYLPKTNLVMSYDGDYHTQVYANFFTSYYPDAHEIWSFKSKKRCVDVPVAIAREFCPNTSINIY
jgi:hypothetical protein